MCFMIILKWSPFSTRLQSEFLRILGSDKSVLFPLLSPSVFYLLKPGLSLGHRFFFIRSDVFKVYILRDIYDSVLLEFLATLLLPFIFHFIQLRLLLRKLNS